MIFAAAVEQREDRNWQQRRHRDVLCGELQVINVERTDFVGIIYRT